MSQFIDLTDKIFGMLAIIKRIGTDKWGQSRWLCMCDCGNKTIVVGSSLKRGLTQSCGCLNKEKVIKRSTKHGHCRRGKVTGFYKSWQDMIKRCTDPNCTHYSNYGGRGIVVCKRWLKFENFLKDMGEAPLGLTLDRMKNEKGYYKENCRWATSIEQARNRRNNLYVPYNGENRLFVELCEEHNISYHIVYARIYKLNWLPERALTEPVRRRKNNG